jgi:hypothetical protein
MNTKKTICLFLACLTTLVWAVPSAAKAWRGIQPLVSTRADVQRLLGTPQQSTRYAFFYSLPKEIAVVRFQSGPCDQFGLGWNVPAYTVVGMGVIPKTKRLKKEFFNGSNYKLYKENAGFLYYADENGMSVETFKGDITSLDYAPTDRDEVRRCPVIEKCCWDIFPLFDRYQTISYEDEKARLENFAIIMKEGMNRGAIVVYGQSRKDRDNLIKRAQRGLKYLAQKQGIEKNRILIVDGGYREQSATELNLYSIGGLGSRVYLFPQMDPKERIIVPRQ